MTQNTYGSTISPRISTATTAQAQAVIDSAITVWMQMGLTQDQILYGIAMMNVESGYNPVAKNNVGTDSIRGLGQINTGTWNADAKSFGSQYQLPAATLQFLSNANFNPSQPEGTNAQAGEGNDGQAGVYDPDGLVTQLENVGEGILKEWAAATSSNEVAAAQSLVARGVQDASLFNPNSSDSSPFLATVALAYLNHHEGSAWWYTKVNEKGTSNFEQTVSKLTNADHPGQLTGLATAIKGVVQGVEKEIHWLNTQVADPTDTPSDLLVEDPWQDAGAAPSLSDPGAFTQLQITRNIPSIFPTIDDFYSDTDGGLSSYVETPAVTHNSKSGALVTDQVSYTFSSNGSSIYSVLSGSADFNFDSRTGSGTQVFGSGDTLTYTLSSTLSGYSLQASESDASGNLIDTMTDYSTVLAGSGIESQIFGNGSAVTSGHLVYTSAATETLYEGFYDAQGRLIAASYSTLNQTAPNYQPISTSDANYAQEAAALAQQYGVPVTDAYMGGASAPPTNSSTTVDTQGNSTTDSTVSNTSATTSADPGFRADAVQKDGNTLQWSFSADGTILSRDIADSGGDLSSEDFDPAGNFIGTSTTTVYSDGSTYVQTYDTQGNLTGAKITIPYGAGTSFTINGVTTTYADGCTVTQYYGAAGATGPVSKFTIGSTVQNADGSDTTTEMTYQPVTNSDGSTTETLVGSTITQVNGDDVTSTDYDANGVVLDSRTMVTNSDGATTVDQFNAAGTLTGSATFAMDSQGDITLQSFDSSGTLTDSKELSSGGVLTETQYQSGSVSAVLTSSATVDGGNLTVSRNAAGQVTGDQWVLSDGSYGSDTMESGGGIAGSSHFSDATSSNSVNDGSGHITTTNYNAAGVATGTTTIVAQGGSVSSQFVSASGVTGPAATVAVDGSIQASVAQTSGASVGISVDAADDVSWTSNTGSGTTTADQLDSNGSLSGTAVTTAGSDGSVTVTSFDSTGSETGYSQTTTSNGTTTTLQYTDADGTFTESGYTQTATNADGSVTTADYSVANGVSTETGYSNTVTNSDGGSTTTTYALNTLGVFVLDGTVVVSSDEQGHVTKAEYSGAGYLTGYTLERTDSAGDVLITQYDAYGNELRSTTVESSGVVIDDVLDGDNGAVTTTWQTDGTFQQVSNDGEGDLATANYAANGSLVSDSWTQADGSSGQDTVNADGSVLSDSNDGQGNLTTSTTSATGEVTSVTDYYDHGSLTADVDTDSPSWGLLSSTRVVTSADGLTTTTSNYNSSGTLLNSNTVVTSSDGLTLTTTSYDGSGNLLGTTTNVTSADGLTITESDYDAAGNLSGYQTQVTSSDGNTVTTSNYNGSGQLQGSTVEVTSSDGLTVTTSTYDGSEQLQGSTVAVTSSDGLTVTTSTYDGSQDLLGTSIAVTSADGQTTTTTDHNADNVLTGQTVVLSSENGTATSTYTYGVDGEITSDQIAFPGDVEPGNLKISTAFVNGTPSLVIEVPTDSITLPGGLSADIAAVTSVTFGVGVTMSLDQLIQHAASLGNVSATTIAGASGNLIFDPNSGDSLTGGSGQDTLLAWGDNDTVSAGAAGNFISAGGSADWVKGGTGEDTLEAFGAGDTLQGGSGYDVFEVADPTDVVLAGTGLDSLVSSVSYTLPTGVDVMTLTGDANLIAYGNADAGNEITGNSGNDQIVAGSGVDTLISGSGIDTLVGGQGADTFVVNNSSDVIQLPYGGLGDTVQSSVNYTVNGAGALQLTGSGDLVGADESGSAVITANSGDDTLIGGSGSDTLVAGSGSDTLITGTGATTLVVNSADDSVVVSPGAHGDTLISSVSQTLAGGLDILELQGSTDLTGQGNDDATNLISANSGNDVLVAGSGADTLTAGIGQDTLIAGSGTDLLDGRSGKDETFVLDPGFGTTTLLLASQSSTIQFGAGISAADLAVTTVIDSLGNLALQISDGNSVVTIDDGTSQGLDAFNLPNDNLTFDFAGQGAMSLAQVLAAAQVSNSTLIGASGDLLLGGEPGASLVGGTGDDTLLGAGTGDVLVAGSGNNQMLYADGNQEQLSAGVGGDTLYGFGSEDTLAAGSGNTVIYAGGEAGTYTLTAGATLTLNSDGDQGPQTLILPEGMTIADFTPYTFGNDLYLASGDTSVLIKGFFSDPNAGHWVLSDDTGNGQLLSLWATATQSSGGGGTSGGGTRINPGYQAEINDLGLVYTNEMESTLKSLGENDETIVSPSQPRDPNYYAFNGLSVDSITVPGGANVAVPTSDNDNWQEVTYDLHYETVTYTEAVYGWVSHPATTFFDPVDSPNYLEDPGYTSIPEFSSSGSLSGWEVSAPAVTDYEQVGTQTVSETIPVYQYYTTDSQAFTLYNITGQGSNITISADAPFVGTVYTGDGNNVNVQLGLYSDYWFNRSWDVIYKPGMALIPGAFIDVGNGLDDYILGSVGVDTIAAGLGVDTIEAGWGSTVYVPMAGASIDTINIVNPPFYGSGPFPHSTLVLPEGVTAADLQFKLFAGLPSYTDTLFYRGAPETLQVTYGDSTLLLEFDSGSPSPYLTGASSDDTAGINYFEFSDGTTLTRAQVLAMAGAAITPDDTYNPVITQGMTAIAENSTESAANLFTSSDASGSTVSVYRIVNDATDGAYFTLDGQTYSAGEEFDVAANQLSQLQLTAGGGQGSEVFVVSGFDGWAWGQTTNVDLNVTSSDVIADVFQAAAADQTVQGASSGPDTLTGGYDGDVLEGNSGQDTFTYATGGGDESIAENAATTATSANTLQFGTGITASALTATIEAGRSLTLSTGSAGDGVTIEGFDPFDPLGSMSIQQFGFASGSSLTFAQLLSQVQSSSTEQYVTNPDGTSTVYAFNPGLGPVYYAKLLDAQGQLTQEYMLNSDGSTETDQYTYNADGSSSDTEVQTTAAGVATTTVTDTDAQGSQASTLTTYPNGSTDYVTYDSEGRHSTELQTDATGDKTASTYSYNSDGSYTVTNVQTSAGGGSATTVVWDIDTQGNLVGSLQTNPDGSTLYDSWNDQGQKLSEVGTAADGATNDTTYAYNADGSYTTTEVETPAGGTPVTTEVVSYDTSGNELNDNSYTPGASGSYSDEWSQPDGSSGAYWWNSSTDQYGESWTHANGTSWTDDYQYASGGSPGGTGVSFTETYSDSAGDQGTRQYDASTGTTTVTWYSAATGTITGTVTDSGFIGLQNDGELTNTQPDLSFFNPATSPTFQNFLAGHG